MHFPFTTWSTYGPPFLGKHGDTFRRSSLCNLITLLSATPRPCIGRTQKSPPFRDNKRLQYFIPRHILGSADCHRFFFQSFYLGLGIVRYVLLQKHLVIIPFIVFIPDDTALAWNILQRVHLQHPTTCWMRRPTQPVRSTPSIDWRLPLLLPSSNGNWHSKPAPLFTPFQFR